MCVVSCVCVLLSLLQMVAQGAPDHSGWAGEWEPSSDGPQLVRGQRARAWAAAGARAELPCRVAGLGDNGIVSWVRSRDLQILSHGGVVFTADPRVSVSVEDAPDASSPSTIYDEIEVRHVQTHVLRIEHVRASDAGRYECQVNTEPKTSLLFNLTVLDESLGVISVSAVSDRVSARAGNSATLACRARYGIATDAAISDTADDATVTPLGLAHLPPIDIQWLRDGVPIDEQRGGGVSVESDRWWWGAVSRATLHAVRAVDAGRYECRAHSVLSHSTGTEPRTWIDMDVARGEMDMENQLEVMQRDQAAVARVSSGYPLGPTSLYLMFTILFGAQLLVPVYAT